MSNSNDRHPTAGTDGVKKTKRSKESATVAVSLPIELIEKLDERAEELEMSRSAFYRLVLKNYEKLEISWRMED